jgi:hypothetical protein
MKPNGVSLLRLVQGDRSVDRKDELHPLLKYEEIVPACNKEFSENAPH